MTRGIALAESAFISVWASLGSFHEDLVLVGGLVPKYLCREKTTTANLPLPATLDVDIGIALAASAGQYGSISMDLAGQGFRMSETYSGRFEKNVEGFSIYIDFLVERPGACEGTVAVDDIHANILPGINRALAIAPRGYPCRTRSLRRKPESCRKHLRSWSISRHETARLCSPTTAEGCIRYPLYDAELRWRFASSY